MKEPNDPITVGVVTFVYSHQHKGWLCKQYGVVSNPIKAQNLAEKLNGHLNGKHGSQIYVH